MWYSQAVQNWLTTYSILQKSSNKVANNTTNAQDRAYPRYLLNNQGKSKRRLISLQESHRWSHPSYA